MRFINGVKIEKGVPTPKRQPHGFWVKVLDSMTLSRVGNPGESFTVPSWKIANNIHGCARQAGMGIQTSKVENGYRIWRVR